MTACQPEQRRARLGRRAVLVPAHERLLGAIELAQPQPDLAQLARRYSSVGKVEPRGLFDRAHGLFDALRPGTGLEENLRPVGAAVPGQPLEAGLVGATVDHGRPFAGASEVL